jgi:hypothetical protein
MVQAAPQRCGIEMLLFQKWTLPSGALPLLRQYRLN